MKQMQRFSFCGGFIETDNVDLILVDLLRKLLYGAPVRRLFAGNGNIPGADVDIGFVVQSF